MSLSALRHAQLPPPSRLLAAAELRALPELLGALTASPLLKLAPRGDGHGVLVLPGFLADDLSTLLLRRFLSSLGYQVRPWGLGRNLGPTPDLEDRLHHRLAETAAAGGGRVSLVGWSLGGVYAREIAREAPALVRQVVSLASPFAAGPKATNVWRLFERVSGRTVDDLDPAYMDSLAAPIPVPSTAVYSEGDGIVAWRACLEQPGPLAENIRVWGSHCGLGHNLAVLFAIADRLAQAEGRWTPFRPSGLASLCYPRRRAGPAPP